MTTKSTVLILGASRGLGLAMAEEWLKRDAKVIATQRSASRDLSELQGRYPGSLEIETVDISPQVFGDIVARKLKLFQDFHVVFASVRRLSRVLPTIVRLPTNVGVAVAANTSRWVRYSSQTAGDRGSSG